MASGFDRRRVAKALFQKPARLEVAGWVLARPSEKFFSLDTLAKGLPGTQKSEAHACVGLMVELGMLDRVSPVPNRPQYRRTASPLWLGFAAFVEAFASLDAGAESGLEVADEPEFASPAHIADLPHRRRPR